MRARKPGTAPPGKVKDWRNIGWVVLSRGAGNPARTGPLGRQVAKVYSEVSRARQVASNLAGPDWPQKYVIAQAWAGADWREGIYDDKNKSSDGSGDPSGSVLPQPLAGRSKGGPAKGGGWAVHE